MLALRNPKAKILGLQEAKSNNIRLTKVLDHSW